ncbi:MAG: hypothetical protein R2761_16135 [Acidimicrobiales bacterium]
MLADSYRSDRCATCRWWELETIGVGICTLATDEYSGFERPMLVTCSAQLKTRLDFGCIFHAEEPKAQAEPPAAK